MKKTLLALIPVILLAGCTPQHEADQARFAAQYPILVKSYSNNDLCHALGMYYTSGNLYSITKHEAESRGLNVTGDSCRSETFAGQQMNQQPTYTTQTSTGSQVAYGVAAGLNAAMQQQQIQQQQQRDSLRDLQDAQDRVAQQQRDSDLHSIANSLNRIN